MITLDYERGVKNAKILITQYVNDRQYKRRTILLIMTKP